jgi:hypothetical protein
MYEHLTRPQLNTLLEQTQEQVWNARDFLAALQCQETEIRMAIRAAGELAVRASVHELPVSESVSSPE